MEIQLEMGTIDEKARIKEMYRTAKVEIFLALKEHLPIDDLIENYFQAKDKYLKIEYS